MRKLPLKSIQKTIYNFNYKNTKMLYKEKNYNNLKIYRNLHIKSNPKHG